MARPLRIEYPGAVYHITARGNARNRIFLEDKDRDSFLEILSDTRQRYNWLCHAFCLMDNHYHLLIETIDPTLSRGMRQLNGVYTQSFNRRHNRVGHVFQGRYKAILVQKETHLLELCRYVVLNPVRAKMVEKPGAWEWSSYNSTASKGSKPDWLTTDWILGQFAQNKKAARESYRKFVESCILEKTSPWDRLEGQMFFGSKNFIHSIKEGDERIKEIPKAQRYANRIKLKDLLQDIKNKPHRNEKVWMAYTQYGYTMKEIADYLSIHYTTVSKIINQRKK
ncbi:transposase [uncultured Desulfobacter sp.]|uniref:REP-associated tyrosine transposase n=1 Tax=uncultured Desulfobacter sp. TaxID=240139 RepID=UPI0029F5B7FB|nr:transposase [uncultured Desulfobacter sp.]